MWPLLCVSMCCAAPADAWPAFRDSRDGISMIRSGNQLNCVQIASSDETTAETNPVEQSPTKKGQAPMTPANQQPAKASAYPDLPKAITSFGAAVLDGAIYVYGGFEGRAHHYYDQGQSGDLLRLNLDAAVKPDAKWENVGTGPRLQGLALVACREALYRLGGFEARNPPVARIKTKLGLEPL